MLGDQLQRVGFAVQIDVLVACENFVPALFLVPLGQGGRHVHLLNDVAPAHAGIVSAEGNFAFLRGVRNDALFGAAEIVVEQILEPHACDKQEVPAILAALLDVRHGAVACHLAVVAAGCAKALIKLGQHVGQLESGRSAKRIVVPQ